MVPEVLTGHISQLNLSAGLHRELKSLDQAGYSPVVDNTGREI